MNTAYTSTTTVQENRNRYNTLLAQALERIKARKTAQEPEEVTTTATEVTTTQQPEPVATPEEVTTTRTKTASPKPLGRDIYHIFTDKYSRWPSLLDSGVYHDPNGYALLSDNIILIGSKIDYNSARSGELVKEYGTTGDARLSDNASLLKARLTEGAVYTIDPDTITKKIKEVRDEAKYKKAREIFGDDLSISELNEELKYNKDIRREATKATKYSYVEFVLPKIGKVYTSKENIDRLVKVSKQLALSELRVQENKIQFEGDAGFVLVCVCTEGLNYRAENLFVTIDLTDAMTPTEEDATPAPEDTPAIEEATPATAPQPTPEDTTTAPEEVTTEESPELTVEQEDDNAPVLLDLIKRYGNVGADYLDTLDYTQAEAREYRSVKGGVSKPEQKYYTIGDRTMYGLFRRYNRNGKRARFAVYQDGQMIEARTYGKNNSCYYVDIQYNGGKFGYNVKDGIITGGTYTTGDKLIIVRFDDTNRPETPRDLPAPAPTKTTKQTSKETTKEAPATAPTPEPIDTPEEVQEVTTSKPTKEDPAPYWLLLDNELRAQQEEQEQALATPEKSEQEPEEEPAPATEATEDPEEVVFLKGAELDKVIAEYSERNGLDIEYQNKRYYFYATADGYIVKLDKNKPKSRLYIADEGPYYDSYRKGEITDRTIFFEQNMNILGDYSRQRLESPVNCNVRRTITGDLSIDPFGKIEYSYDPATGKSEEIPVKHPTTRELAIYVAARKAYEDDQRERLEKYWKRYGHKVWVDTYWANR